MLDINKLTRIYHIDDHPIKGRSVKHRHEYAGALMFVARQMGEDDEYLAAVCRHWIESFIEKANINELESDIKMVKKALRLKREGWHLFRMEYEFFFDCFYLVETWDAAKMDALCEYLKESVCNRRAKTVCDQVYQHFKRFEKCDKLPNSLVRDRLMQKQYESKPMKKVMVVANLSAGKSTLINALVGEKVCKSANAACTSNVNYIVNKPCSDGVTIYDFDTDAYRLSDDTGAAIGKTHYAVSLNFSSTLSQEKICIIDTPGANNAVEDRHRAVTIDAIKSIRYDLLLFVINAKYFGTTDDDKLLHDVKKYAKSPIIFVLNQVDEFVEGDDSIVGMVSDCKRYLSSIGFRDSVVLPASAKAAFAIRLGHNGKKTNKRMCDFMMETFGNPFYDLPFNIGLPKSTSPLEATGIVELGKAIINNII